MRRVLGNGFLAIAITTIAAFGADNSLGTWKLNIAKSKYGPGPMPLKSLTVRREAVDGGVKVTTTGERADGAAVQTSYTAKYDGSQTHVTGSGAPYDMIALKQVNADNINDERSKMGGPYRAKGHTVISNGGNIMTITIKGTDGDGKEFSAAFVYEKQ